MTTADLIRHNSPFGVFHVLAVDDVVLAASWNESMDAIVARVHVALRPDAVRARSELGRIGRALRAYDDGDCQAIDEIAVNQHSGPFHARIRDELRAIPPGSTSTYAELAATAGRPGAARAAGSACARNAIALFVPCHRAVGSDGSLRGFAYGLDHKAALLEHERRHALAGDSARVPTSVGS
jgi:methylated-DNA-[protein]-cysteine S-methyltransferase